MPTWREQENMNLNILPTVYDLNLMPVWNVIKIYKKLIYQNV